MPTYDVTETDARTLARLVKTAVSPRPVAWVSTRSPDGVDNLAPYSSYNYLCLAPPVLQVNASPRADGRRKDTPRNAVESGAFAVNVVTAADLERMDRTSEAVPPDRSEFDLAGVDRAPCRTIAAPRVAGAAVTLECTLHDTLEVHDRTSLLGDVRFVHVDPAVTTDGDIDATELASVGRLGGPYYTVAEPVPYERQY
ncbi:MAG: flavin reductase family protein [Halobacteriales archaeon]